MGTQFVTLYSDEAHQANPDYETSDCQERVDRDRVFMECVVGQGIQSILGEIRETGNTDDSSVDATEGCEAKNLCRVVTVFVSTGFGRVLDAFGGEA